MKRSLAALAILVLAVLPAGAASTVNPNIPTASSPLSSAVMRGQFAATATDINNLLGKFANSSAPLSPSNLQDWCDTSGTPLVVCNIYNQGTGTWAPFGTMNTSTGVFTPYIAGGAIAAVAPLSVSISGGVATISLSGIVGLAHGGTNAALTASNGGLLYSTGSALAVLAGTATAGQIPRSGASAAPSWSTATYPATIAANQVLASSGGANIIAGTSTLPSAVQDNITRVGVIVTEVRVSVVDNANGVSVFGSVTGNGWTASPKANGSNTDLRWFEYTNGSPAQGYRAAWCVGGLFRFGNGNACGTSMLESAGSFGAAIGTQSANHTADSTDNMILCDASAGGVTIALPDPTTVVGRDYIIKKVDSTRNYCEFTSTSIEGGLTSFLMTRRYEARTIRASLTTGWWFKS